MNSKEIRVYDIIDKKVGSNVAMQGLSGLAGFPFTALADVAVLFSHYAPMLNEIRAVYGRSPITKADFGPILSGCKQELLTDMVLDKIIGNIPLFGLPANMICAKAMTWRLGILFGMLAARGEDVSQQNVANAVQLIRKLFPQKNSLMFQKPSAGTVEKLLKTVDGDSVETFDQKVNFILDALA